MRSNEKLEFRFLGLVIKMSALSWKGVVVVICVLLFFLLRTRI